MTHALERISDRTQTNTLRIFERQNINDGSCWVDCWFNPVRANKTIHDHVHKMEYCARHRSHKRLFKCRRQITEHQSPTARSEQKRVRVAVLRHYWIVYSFEIRCQNLVQNPSKYAAACVA